VCHDPFAAVSQLKQAILYIERNPKIVKSITSFPYICGFHGSDRSVWQGLGGWWISSRWCSPQDSRRSLQIVGDGGEMNLKSSFGQATPSHPPEAVTPLPCAEDLLDLAATKAWPLYALSA
jgi:hypothetical protein